MSLSVFLRTIGNYTNVENFKNFSTQNLKNLVENFTKNHPDQYSKFIGKNPNLISTVLNIQEKKDVEKYTKLLETSNSEVELFYLSKLYEEGIFVKKDEQKSKEFLEKAKKINENTISDLSKDLPKGEKNSKESLKKAKKIKESPPTLVMDLLKDEKTKGKKETLSQDVPKSVSKKGSKEKKEIKNIGDVLLILAQKFYQTKNYQDALKYFEDSFEKGNQESSKFIGEMYFQGLGCQINKEKAQKHLEIASDDQSKYYLGLIHFERKDVKKGLELIKESSKTFQKAKDFLVYTRKEISEIKEKHKRLKLDNTFDQSLITYYILFTHQSYKIQNWKEKRNWKEKFQKYFLKDEDILMDYNLHSLILNIFLKERTEESIKKILESKSFSELLFLSKLYEYGEIISKDEIKSKELLNEALKINEKDTLYMLGKLEYFVNNFTLALKHFEESFEKGNQDSTNFLGKMYYQGLGCQIDYQKSIKFLEICTDPKFKYYLGRIYFDQDFDIPKDEKKSFNNFKISFDHGNLQSAPHLGYFYSKGLPNLKKDRNQAKLYFEMMKDHPVSLHYLGVYYYYGIVVEKDFEKSLEYFKKSYNKVNIISASFLTCIYYHKGDYINAMKYFQIHSNFESQYYAGLMFIKGLGVEKDVEKGLKLIKESSKNYQGAQTFLKINDPILRYIIDSSSKNSSLMTFYILFIHHPYNRLGNWKEEIEKYFSRDNNSLMDSSIINIFLKETTEESIKKILESKSESGLLFLNKLYEYGEIISKDEIKSKELLNEALKINEKDTLYMLGKLKYFENNFTLALKHFEESFEKGNQDSTNFLGKMYLYGIGCKPDLQKSIKFLEMCTDPKFKHFLGRIYFEEKYGVRNDKESFKYFNISFDHGNLESAPYLGYFYHKGLAGLERDEKKAKFYLEMKNHIFSYYLGHYYFYGRNVKKDLEKSKEYFEISLKKGEKKSATFLGIIYLKKREYAKAKSYFEITPESDISIYEIGLMYLNGLGVEKDVEKGFKMIEKAAQMNHQQAKILNDLQKKK